MKSAWRHLKAVEGKMRLCRRKKNLVRHQFESLPITVHAIFAVKCKMFFFFLGLFISFFYKLHFISANWIFFSLECASLSHGVFAIGLEVLRSKKDNEKIDIHGRRKKKKSLRWGGGWRVKMGFKGVQLSVNFWSKANFWTLKVFLIN